MQKANPFTFISYLGVGLTFIILLFIVAGLLAMSSTSLSKGQLKSWSDDVKINDLLIYVVSGENHYFSQGKNVRLFSFSDMSLAFTANIKPNDIRTFLGRELPGFSAFDTEIVVAGEGTDFTNLPIESAPPMDVLLKEREITSEKLKEEPESPTPPVAPGEESVYVYHTHSWESFTPLLRGVTDGSDAVSSNEKVNVVALGRKLTDELNRRGIGTIHDTTNMTDKLQERGLTYSSSYGISRELVQTALAQNERLHYLIDIHRDSATRDKTTKVINGKSYAKLYFIVGKEHKDYEHNEKVAIELNEKLEEEYPGISRGVFRKGKQEGNGVYNQDLSERALLVEFGGVENDLDELYNTVEAFAEVFSEYYFGEAEMVNG